MKNTIVFSLLLFSLLGCVSDKPRPTSAELDEMRNYQPSLTSIPGVLWATFNDSCTRYYGDSEFGFDELDHKLSRITGQPELSKKEKGDTLLGEDARIWRLSYAGGHADIGVSAEKPEACVAIDDRFNKVDIKKHYEEIQADPRYQVIQKCSLKSEANWPTEIWILENRLFPNIATVSVALEQTKGTKLAVFAMPENRLKGLTYLVDQCLARIQ